MSKIKNWAVRKAVALQTRDEEGQGLAEYGLILALIAVVCIGALQLLGGSINTTLGQINGAF
jgi:pilus assembly protein Flp/PilA